MKKVLKFMSLLLIVPVLGIGSLLTGCGKKEASIEDILDDYNKMVYGYQLDKEDKDLDIDQNVMFKFKNEVAVTNENTYNYFKNTAALNGDEEQNNEVTFKVSLGDLVHTVTASGKSNELVEAYAQLQDDGLYAKLLNYSNMYFERYQNSFFAATGVDAEELYDLREKLSNLNDKVSAFYSNLENRQSLATFLGKDTEIMRTKLHTFNSVYVDLIEANFEFVLKFCDIHKNYVLNADTISEEATKEQVIAERYTYEAALKYAYGYFLDNIKAYNKNGLCNSYAHSVMDENDSKYNFVLTSEVDGIFSDLATKTIKADKAPELKQAIARVDAFTKLYKTNIDSFDMYTYNLLRTDSVESLYESMEEFRESLSASDKARLTMIESYAKYDLQLLRSAIAAMF